MLIKDVMREAVTAPPEATRKDLYELACKHPDHDLFIVTDGVEDYVYGGSRNYGPINVNANWCQTIKNRGIRIAFLYLTYNPLPTNGWYNTYIAPIQPTIATTAQNCASAGLFFQVNTDGDVSSALNALFQKAVATAYLTS